MTDFIGDMITRIKNGQKIKLCNTEYSSLSNINIKILKILYKEGYIRGYVSRYNTLTKKNESQILLKYNLRGEPIIKNLKKISTPGRRIYISIKTLWQPQSTTGLYIISTTKGYLTDVEARRLNVGGELLLHIW